MNCASLLGISIEVLVEFAFVAVNLYDLQFRDFLNTYIYMLLQFCNFILPILSMLFFSRSYVLCIYGAA